MKKALIFLIIALMIAGCADKRRNRDEEAVARTMFEALREKDVRKFGTCIVTAEDVEYVMTFFSLNSKEYEAMTLEEKHEFEELFQKRVERMQIEWQERFNRMIGQLEAIWEQSDIEWGKIRMDGYSSAFSDFDIAYMPRYGEFYIEFHQGDRHYRLHTDGIVKIHDQWKLQLGEFTLEVMDDKT